MGRKKPKQNKQDQRPRSPKKVKTKSLKDYYDEVMKFFQVHKITFMICFAVFFVFYLKFAEEANSYIHGKQADENLYETLGLDKTAKIKDIKKKYNKLVIEYHPDKNPNCSICQEKFGKISKAYEILSKENSKTHYDQTNGILEPIESRTYSLTIFNYFRLVEESPRPWIIQVYSESEGIC